MVLFVGDGKGTITGGGVATPADVMGIVGTTPIRGAATADADADADADGGDAIVDDTEDKDEDILVDGDD